MHGNAQTLKILKTMFGWAFSPDNVYRGYVKPEPIEIDGPFNYGNLRISPLPVVHGVVETSGFLFEQPGRPTLAYIPDVKEVPASTMDLIQNVDLLVIDSLRPASHPTHLSVVEALAVIEASNAQRAWLTHLGHENDHSALNAELPPKIRVAYDGLRIPE
jgi:phosphoribosyl 1,2-cyclic phosphate phosphodiesterase